MSELYAIEKSTLDSIGSAVKGIKNQVGTIPVAQLAHEINNIATFTVNGEKVLESKAFEMEEFDIYKSAMPAGVVAISAVVWRGDLYVIGADKSTDTVYTYLYKFNGKTWDKASTTVIGTNSDTYGHAVIFEDAIYAIGLSSLKRWDGESWQMVVDLCDTYRTPQVIGVDLAVFNGEIHIFGSPYEAYNNLHYKWDGVSLVQVGSNVPMSNYKSWGSFITYNGEIHRLEYNYHHKWDGSTWTRVSTIPYSVGVTNTAGLAVIDGELHVFGGYTGPCNEHYKWDGSSWTALGDLPIHFYRGASAVVNGALNIIGSVASDWNGDEYPAHNSHIELGAKRYKEVAV